MTFPHRLFIRAPPPIGFPSLLSPYTIVPACSGIAKDGATPYHPCFLFFHITRFSIMAASLPQPSPSLSSNAHFSSQFTNVHLPAKSRPSDPVFRPDKTYAGSIASTPEVQINGRPRQPRPSTSSGASTHTHDDKAWGSHFWVTLVDPQASLIATLLVCYLWI